jgi:hypothetical protein
VRSLFLIAGSRRFPCDTAGVIGCRGPNARKKRLANRSLESAVERYLATASNFDNVSYLSLKRFLRREFEVYRFPINNVKR